MPARDDPSVTVSDESDSVKTVVSGNGDIVTINLVTTDTFDSDLDIDALDPPLTRDEMNAAVEYATRSRVYDFSFFAKEWPALETPGYFPSFAATGKTEDQYRWIEVDDRYPPSQRNWCSYNVVETSINHCIVPAILDTVKCMRLAGCGNNAKDLYDVILYIARKNTVIEYLYIILTTGTTKDVHLERMLNHIFTGVYISIEYCGDVEQNEPYYEAPAWTGRWLRVTTALLCRTRIKGPVAMLPTELIRRAMVNLI
jgi:hypothetical protein